MLEKLVNIFVDEFLNIIKTPKEDLVEEKKSTFIITLKNTLLFIGLSVCTLFILYFLFVILKK